MHMDVLTYSCGYLCREREVHRGIHLVLLLLTYTEIPEFTWITLLLISTDWFVLMRLPLGSASFTPTRVVWHHVSDCLFHGQPCSSWDGRTGDTVLQVPMLDHSPIWVLHAEAPPSCVVIYLHVALTSICRDVGSHRRRKE